MYPLHLSEYQITFSCQSNLAWNLSHLRHQPSLLASKFSIIITIHIVTRLYRYYFYFTADSIPMYSLMWTNKKYTYFNGVKFLLRKTNSWLTRKMKTCLCNLIKNLWIFVQEVLHQLLVWLRCTEILLYLF